MVFGHFERTVILDPYRSFLAQELPINLDGLDVISVDTQSFAMPAVSVLRFLQRFRFLLIFGFQSKDMVPGSGEKKRSKDYC